MMLMMLPSIIKFVTKNRRKCQKRLHVTAAAGAAADVVLVADTIAIVIAATIALLYNRIIIKMNLNDLIAANDMW